MYKGKKIAVIVPAFNEERFIAGTLNSVPNYVDYIVVINDHSTDNTLEEIQRCKRDSLVIISHKERQGVGGAIVSGYKKALELKADISVVMAGDGQMDPKDMKGLIEPIIKKQADYVKGNRLLDKEIKKIMPIFRFIGNKVLSFFTRISSGYWNLDDTQCGYTAISRQALLSLNLDTLYKDYGFPNDILFKLSLKEMKIEERKVRPIYGAQKSGINFFTATVKIPLLIFRNFLFRMLYKLVSLYSKKPLKKV
jgi:glycosyltransferase involved in cell wall biosynthesis